MIGSTRMKYEDSYFTKTTGNEDIIKVRSTTVDIGNTYT